MASLQLTDHHKSLILNYLRFAKFQRSQCLKAIKNSFLDAKDTKLLDDTYTIEEIEDILRDIREIVQLEAESELINAAHTNVLLLHQIFGQAQKWHLELEANLADLENRDLLDQVKRWEDSECISGGIEDSKPMVQKKLAPLNEGGPMQLLKIQIEQANEENQMLRNRLKEVEQKAIDSITEKKALQEKLQDQKQQKEAEVKEASADDKIVAKEVEEMAQAFKEVKNQMATELELNAKTQKELETDLTSTKHNLLDIQHQLSLAEKELEKKFSQTGAYKNLKKMLTAKNEQIKELRQKLRNYEEVSDNE